MINLDEIKNDNQAVYQEVLDAIMNILDEKNIEVYRFESEVFDLVRVPEWEEREDKDKIFVGIEKAMIGDTPTIHFVTADLADEDEEGDDRFENFSYEIAVYNEIAIQLLEMLVDETSKK
jgi:hypothetical protein